MVLIGLAATWRVVTWSDRGGMLEAHGVSPNSQYQHMPVDGGCLRVVRGGETCTPVSPGIAAIDLRDRSPIQLLRDLQLTVRPF